MDIKTYLTESEKTLSNDFYISDERAKLLHAAMGISTEAGEILDTLKKTLYYGKELDIVNLKEEVGDVMWYIAILLRELDLDFEDVLDINIQKLRKRYGEKFDHKKSLERDLDAEREVLEKE